MDRNPAVDGYLTEGCGRCPLGGTPACKVHHWPEVLQELRRLVGTCGLTEELKWGVPCYSWSGKNMLLISALKDYCALSFFKGALLDHSTALLEKPGPHTQAARVIKFQTVAEIHAQESAIRALIFEAIEVEEAGLQVVFKQAPEPIPEELQVRLAEDPVLRAAFEGLSPGRQRGYILHFSQPKQSQTRSRRIEKWTPNILNGAGMHDNYRSKKK